MPDALARAFPPLRSSGDPRRSLAEWRRARALRRTVRRVCVPPPASYWAAFGSSLVIPPARVDNADLISIGDGVVIHENVWLSVVRHFPEIDTRLVIEDCVRIGRSCQLSVAGEVVIERGAIIGDFVQIGDTYHPYEVDHRFPLLVPPRAVRVGRGAVIASHAVVLPGVTIGPGAYVEHHSVVSADVPPNAVVAGRPARPVDR
jgi:acetyltransferase-like isoleucine patch superfamily enzyme